MVVGIGVPRPIDLERPGGLAARRVAQVGRDTAVLVLEFRDRVERRPVRHEADGRVLAPAGKDEQREARAGLLVVNADMTILVERHGVPLSRPAASIVRWAAYNKRGSARASRRCSPGSTPC